LLRVKTWRRLRLECDGTRAETIFRLSAKRTSPFKSAGASVHSTTGSRAVRISGSNAGYTKFRGSVKGTGYPLHSPVSPSLPLTCVTVCHQVSTGLYHETTYRSYITRPSAEDFYFTLRRVLSMSRRDRMNYIHPPKFLLEVQDFFPTDLFCTPFVFLYGEEAKSWENHIYCIRRELYVFQLVALLHRRKRENTNKTTRRNLPREESKPRV